MAASASFCYTTRGTPSPWPAVVREPGGEGELLEFARAGSAAKLEGMVRMWRKLSREGELTAEEARHRSRTFSVFVDGDGMYVVKGRLEPEAGAMLMRAVEAASDALFRWESAAGDDGRDADDERPKPKQRRADAVGLLAERALAAGFGGGEARDDSRNSADGSHDSRDGSNVARGRDLGELGGGLADSSSVSGGEPQAEPRVESGTRAKRYQVMSTAMLRRWRRKASPGARIWTGFASPRRRLGAWRATQRWSRWSTRKTGLY